MNKETHLVPIIAMINEELNKKKSDNNGVGNAFRNFGRSFFTLFLMTVFESESACVGCAGLRV